MVAVIIVAGRRSPDFPQWLSPLTHCVDRPVLQHIVELLVDQGIIDFHFVLHEDPQRVETLLGDGERWGSRFTYHLVLDPEHPYSALRVIGSKQQSKQTLLVHADRLPVLANGVLLELKAAHGRLLYHSQEIDGTTSVAWTGWAYVDSAMARGVPEDSDEAYLEEYFCGKGLPLDITMVKDLLDFRTPEGVLRAQSCMLTDPKLSIHLLAREIEDGIWLGRNVMLHPKAQLIAPAFVGENCRVGARTAIGPNAVISSDSIVDTGTTVQHSAIYPGTYCGQGLALDHVFVDRNRMFDCRLESQLNVSDSFILSALKGDQRHWVRSGVSMIVAAIMSVVTLPVVLITGLVLWMKRGKNVFQRKQVLRVPASDDQADWRFFYLWSFRDPAIPRRRGLFRWFLLDCVPALPWVACGYLRLVGAEPRTRQELEVMADDWKTLFLKAHIGLITEAFVLHGGNATADQVYSSEVYYAAMANIRHDLALAIRFITQTLTAQQEF
jgi:carbonic anhydrase/acetyltransferase-like protein (isoleucine patch superfamily)